MFASKTTSSLKNIKILRPKVTKFLRMWLKKFCEYGPSGRFNQHYAGSFCASIFRLNIRTGIRHSITYSA